MIPATRWRRLAFSVVVLADLLVVLVLALAGPDVLPLAVPLLVVFTARAVFAPEGWAPHLLVLAQVGSYAMVSSTPAAVLDWAVVVLTALAVLATHLALSLLAAWPPRAALPSATAGRTATAFASLGGLAVAGGLAGALAGRTPDTWAGWLVPAAVAATAGLLWVLRSAYRPGVGR